MSKPFCSAIMPTFGRAPKYLHLLQESIYWFTQQTYPDCELVVLNDALNQKLICTVPNVRVINRPERISTLGQKYDALVEEARGEIILPWEDDDISLPHRIQQAVSKLDNNSPYFNPQHSWYEQGGQLTKDHSHGICHNASAYKKGAWELVGGYGRVTGNQDSVFDSKLKAGLDLSQYVIPNPKDWSYVYRWGVSNIHLSAYPNLQEVYDKAEAEPCIVFIEPRMGKDYAKMCSIASQ